jgi:aminomethyltransferase
MKKTALYDEHIDLGGKIVDFGGWALPVQYSGILAEHMAVRQAAGLFDVSHMGEIMIEGPEAEAFIQQLVTNNLAGAEDGRIIYSPMCYENGTVVDDVLIYRYNGQKYLMVVNAANTDKDWQWLQDKKDDFAVELKNISDHISQLALQGPLSAQILAKVSDARITELRFYRFYPQIQICGQAALVSRSGYTGEDGFEIYADAAAVVNIWRGLLAAGADEGILPCGLGARDTLRFEAALPLYGHEISAEILPLEAGLEKFVDLNKANFIGKEALLSAKTAGIKRKLVGLEVIGRGIARERHEVQKDGKNIGFVTSGSYAPSMKKNLAMALLDIDYAQEGQTVDIIIRGNTVAAEIIPRPFQKKKYKK